MKVYISADIEGICGIVNRSHINPQGHDYQRARMLMTKEVNAAIEGATQTGAVEIVVNDSHGPMTNILIEELHPQAQLITGTPKKLGMMEGIDHTFDAVIFVGYHGKMNSAGVLSHSYDGGVISGICINDREVGEFGLNGMVAGHFGVPVVAVTGDHILAEEVQGFNLGIKTVVVKTALGRYTAKCMNPTKACKLIQNTVKIGLEERPLITPLIMEKPISLEMTFLNSGLAETAAIMPGTQMIAPNKVRYIGQDMLEIYRARMAMTLMAESVL
ncbi:MAG: M55 family metallopeptidase [Bacillota bacterium]